ncbi:helix-turn-helix domain-containing protein [Vogesella indigofera]|uniref:Helix-turn-helix transcriptional regulator n=1 Tax=Vogesella indigofera TaxID=45465 RepID=A0ABT5I921_VOGIN|nr:helix-turn-helix transcriptional regulator [Vogesella indigofera]MDC7692618.1 helix-turn-helix transcriptional regulator [Vogesella indigofera]
MAKNNVQLDSRTIRKESGLTQEDFWGIIGITQAGGSRYEQEQRVSPSTQLLIELVHIKGIEPALACGADMAVGRHLRLEQPHEYERLLSLCKKAPKK